MAVDSLYDAAIAGDADAIAQLEIEAERVDEDGDTILHNESRKGNAERVRFILKEFASKNLLVKLNNAKQTALHLAANYGYKYQNPDVVKVLIDEARNLPSPCSANDNTDDNPISSFQAFLRQADKDLNTALHQAVTCNYVEMVKLLVEADPSDRHMQNNEGKTPIYIAADNRYAGIIEVICTTCTAPSLDGPRETALQAVIKYLSPNIEAVKLIIGAARHLPSSASDNDSTHDNPVNSFQAFLRQPDKWTSKSTALHKAVENCQVDVVKLLVEADPSDRHIRDNDGRTPLYLAAEEGYHDIVKVICTTCTAPSLEGPGGSTALHAAIKHLNHDIEAFKLLISAARNLPSSDSDNIHDEPPLGSFEAFLRQGDEDMNTALHIAVMQGNLAIAKLLVEADPSDPRIENNKGETPIYTAVEKGYTDIVKMICTTCTAPFDISGPGGTTVLHAVVRNLDEAKNEVRDVIKMITDVYKRAVISEKEDEFISKDENEFMNQVYEYTIHRSTFAEIIFLTDEYNQTILELAVERNYMEVIEFILDIHNPAYQDSWMDDDFISLVPLIYKAKDNKYKDIVNLLTQRYEAGAELSTESTGLKNQAHLISAIRTRKTESVLSLLDKHAKDLVTFADKLGWTALHHAVYHEFDSIIHPIMKAQDMFRHQFEYEDMVSTPFHVAAEKGYTSTMILLMQLWPSSSSAYTAVDRNGQNILHLAALKSKKEMILNILNYCTENNKNEFVNQQDNNGNTPLHILISRGCLVLELIKYEGIDLRARNKENWTPPDMLYLEDQIMGDQVQIKIQLDNLDISESLVLPSKRQTKDAMFNERAKLMMHEKQAQMEEELKSYKNSHTIAHWFANAIAGHAIAKAALKMEAEKLSEEGETILHVESKKGDTENVRFIVKEFANNSLLGKLDRLKQTALHHAAHHGHIQVVEVLIDAARRNMSSSMNHDDPISSFHAFVRQATSQKRNTALHVAVDEGNVAIVKLLVEADPSDKHIPNDEGKTPIFMAAEKGYINIIEVICTTCTALCLDGPGGSTTALHAAIQNIHQAKEEVRDVIRMMMNAAKRWSPEDSSFEALFKRINVSGHTILELAVYKNYVEVVELILGEDPAYQHGRGSKNNGFMRLIYTAIDKEYKEILKLLGETYEAEISLVHKGVIDLIVAIRRRHRVSVISLLGENKQLVSFADEDGWTALHHAAYHEFDSILEAIIEAQKDVGHQFVYKDLSPFHVAAKEGYTFTVIRLMELWPDWSSAYTNADYNNGQNILHLAAFQSKKEMIQGILKCCPEKYKNEIVNAQDNNGDTPLHLLIRRGCFIQELIKYKGLITMTKNNKDETPLDYFYLVDEIIADQVQIKIALDDIQVDQYWKFWRKNIRRKSNYLESVVLPSRREAKDVQFENAKKKLIDEKHGQMKKDLERYKKRTSTQIVVTALITTVTFTVGFTMPGGLRQSGEVDQGLVVLSKKTAFNAFMVSDALALLLSTCSLFLYFLESMYEDPRQVSKLNAASTGLNIVSVMAMMLTFITGTYVVLSHSLPLAITVSLIGSFFFIFVIVLMIKMVYDRQVKRNED